MLANEFHYLGYIVLFPLIGGLINGILGSRMKNATPWIGTAAVLLSFIFALKSVSMMLPTDPFSMESWMAGRETVLTFTAYQWIYAGDLGVDIAFLLDPLSAVMVLVVTGVGFLIHLYSAGYMSDDPGKWKFFSYLNLFVFSMLLLILGKNLMVTFIGWEGVGACSYLLIGFWYTDMEKAAAGQKAFIVNRIGDFAFLVGLFLLYWETGTLDYLEIDALATGSGTMALYSVAPVAVVLIFIGCTGKSAQIPLYTWLPDAMAGPTPVSALIHAATMVTSGVYLLARLNHVVTLSPVAMMIIASVGALTAFFAATIALVQNDIKKVLAYSTVSQLGYMFIGIGSGMFIGAIFHLMTHAFFKALLFLGSGSVIHSMGGEQDIRKMGGLRKWMPVTHWTFFIACLAIAGIPLFAGFFSKDLILWGAYSNVHVYQIQGVDLMLEYLSMSPASNISSGAPLEPVLAWKVVFGVVFVLGMATALMTAFYMFRLYFLTFWGECRADEETQSHLHESPLTMTIPLTVLAVLSIFGGWTGWPHVVHHATHFDPMLLFEYWLTPVFQTSMDLRIANKFGADFYGDETIAIIGSIVFAFVGVGAAWFAYMRMPGLVRWFYERAQKAHRWLTNKYYVDEFYDYVFVRGFIAFGKALYLADRAIVDGAVNFVGFVAQSAGNVLKNLQSGDVQRYATYIVVAIVLLMFALI